MSNSKTDAEALIVFKETEQNIPPIHDSQVNIKSSTFETNEGS